MAIYDYAGGTSNLGDASTLNDGDYVAVKQSDQAQPRRATLTQVWAWIVGKITANAAAVRTALGLGDMATQSASSVAITGGSVAGIADLAVADGGTGASTASAALGNLGGAPLASPAFTGAPAGPTAAADTGTTQLATTAFVLGQAGAATPSGPTAAGATGASLRYSRQDHQHPKEVQTYVWAGRPTASTNSGLIICVTDIGDGGSLWISNSTEWKPLAPITLGRSGVAASVTGTTTETQLASVTIPAGAIGLNGAVEIETLWTVTGSTNAKTLRARFSGTLGTAFVNQAIATATAVTSRLRSTIRNRGAANSQIGQSATSAGGTGTSTGAVITGSVDTTAATTIYISGQLANTGETITLESYEVRLLP